ncbi:hypothetical protein TNCV_3890901 [Trichonephila clavipes]|nr:hypothetical protein TNCV_3890901 [Trichonephila clavipes]
MATNTSQDVGRSGLSHIVIQTKRVNFKTRHMPLSSSMSTEKLSKSSFMWPTACPKQSGTGRFPSCHSCMVACLQEELISYLTWVTISEKVRQPLLLESLWLLSQAKPTAISFPQTFTRDGTH